MNEDSRQPTDPAPDPPVARDARSPKNVAAALPAGAFTASVLFDVLALVAEGPEQAHSYNRRAVELLKVGLGASLATLALAVVDSLNLPAATSSGKRATRQLALDGAAVAVYLLDLAARQKQVGDARTRDAVADSGSIGLSLVGLALLGASGKLK